LKSEYQQIDTPILMKTFEPLNLDSLADHLITDGYAIVDNFLSPVELERMRATFFSHLNDGHFRTAAVGKQEQRKHHHGVRQDWIHWIEEATLPDCDFFFQRITDIRNFLNLTLYLGIQDQEMHFALYPPGAFYKRHLDAFQHRNARKITLICYLNEGWQDDDGGQLRMYLPEQTLDVSPIGGRLVCFRSELIEHEVLPATRDRLSVTGWLTNQLPFFN